MGNESSREAEAWTEARLKGAEITDSEQYQVVIPSSPPVDVKSNYSSGYPTSQEGDPGRASKRRKMAAIRVLTPEAAVYDHPNDQLEEEEVRCMHYADDEGECIGRNQVLEDLADSHRRSGRASRLDGDGEGPGTLPPEEGRSDIGVKALVDDQAVPDLSLQILDVAEEKHQELMRERRARKEKKTEKKQKKYREQGHLDAEEGLEEKAGHKKRRAPDREIEDDRASEPLRKSYKQCRLGADAQDGEGTLEEGLARNEPAAPRGEEADSREDFEVFCRQSLTTWPTLPKTGETMAEHTEAYRAFCQDLLVYMDIMQARVVPADLVKDLINGGMLCMTAAEKATVIAADGVREVTEAAGVARSKSKKMARALSNVWVTKTTGKVEEAEFLENGNIQF